MKKLLNIGLFVALCALAALMGLPEAEAQRGAGNMARENARSSAEAQARAEIESVLSRLCPGRCELVELRAVVGQPRSVGEVLPGFEGAAGSRFEVEVQRIEATVLMDSNLPESFQANIPRMLQFRLQYLAPTIEVRPEFLDFPQPQLPPMPTPPPRTPEPPRQLPELPPVPEPIAEPTPVEPAPEVVEAQAEEAPLWREILPWIPLILTLLILVALILFLLRQLAAMHDKAAEPRADKDDEGSPASPTMPDAEKLRADLTRSRSVLNRMLRRWIDDDPAEVALLIRLVGPEIIADLRRDPEFRARLAEVSEEVGRHHEPLSVEQANDIAERARSRHAAQLVVDDGGSDTEWDFLESLNLKQVDALLASTTQKERGFVLSRIAPVLRSRYLESLGTDERRRLLLEASSSETLSKSESRELSGRLRQIAEEFIDAGRQAAGQANLLVEMVDAMSLQEQEEVLRDLQKKKPDVAQAVLGQICLESALPLLPEESLANAVHRLPVNTMTDFLRGIDSATADHLLRMAPASRRQALSTELSLDLPSSRADFLEARNRFSSAVLAGLRREGYDITTYNADALRRGAQPRGQAQDTTEVIG